MIQPHNPYDICTWRPAAACVDCPLAEHLKYRFHFHRRHLLQFMGTFLVFAIPALTGVLQSGYGGYPFPFMLLGRQTLWALAALGGLVLFFWALRRYICSRCVNFSCPLNSVPQEIIDAYLARNPVMREAWEDSG